MKRRYKLGGYGLPGKTKASLYACLKSLKMFHPKVSGMNGRAFPMFPSWQILFWKDRATDGGFVFRGPTFIDLSAGGSQAANLVTPMSNANATTPTSNANANASTANPPPKKAKKLTRAEVKQAALNEAFGSYMAESKEVREKLIDSVGF
ncbi:hypothetical protein Vadar_012266 [Vaccinium darrowii]|uniref:Uncharacterized protein n=1 Tax=Vaccinium darrowii TaxID=229202 RepID=A0ACB7XQ38_9ERIC|nr:hypothetical protein Vadar_012266 [Vaccinium darrowii]